MRFEQEEPLATRVLIAPLVTAYDARARNRAYGENGEDRHCFALEGTAREHLEAEVASVISSLALFTDCDRLPAEAAVAEDGVGEGAAGSGAAPVTQPILEQARRDYRDLVIGVCVRRYEVTYDHLNGWWYPNLLNWFMFWAPFWLVADETYSAEIEANVEVWHPNSGRRLLAEPIIVRCAADLDDIDRGLQWLGILPLPVGLDESNWRQVRDYVMPFAHRAFLVRVLDLLGPRLRALTLPGRVSSDVASVALTEATRTRWAVVAGVPVAGSRPCHADRDAALVYALLRGAPALDLSSAYLTARGLTRDSLEEEIRRAEESLREGGASARAAEPPPVISRDQLVGHVEIGGVPAHNAALLIGPAATKAAILQALAEVERRAGPEDEVVFYFAGFGATRTSGRALAVTPTGEGDRASGWLSLAELASSLADIRSRRVAVVLDASFGAAPLGVETRTAPGSQPVGGALADPFDGISQRPAVVLCAGGASDVALELDDERHGMFTWYLDRATRECVNAGGQADILRVFNEVCPRVQELSGLFPEDQDPELIDPQGLASRIRLR